MKPSIDKKTSTNLEKLDKKRPDQANHFFRFISDKLTAIE